MGCAYSAPEPDAAKPKKKKKIVKKRVRRSSLASQRSGPTDGQGEAEVPSPTAAESSADSALPAEAEPSNPLSFAAEGRSRSQGSGGGSDIVSEGSEDESGVKGEGRAGSLAANMPRVATPPSDGDDAPEEPPVLSRTHAPTSPARSKTSEPELPGVFQ